MEKKNHKYHKYNDNAFFYRRLSLKDMKNIVAVKALKDESEPSKIISGDISEDFERTFKEKVYIPNITDALQSL